MTAFNNIFKDIQKLFFDSVVSTRLVYNTCWEDPRVDRELLDIKSNSNIVMLSSAGCNSFDYLLDDPKAIHSVDANPFQTAVSELKKSLFQNGDHDMLWSFFGQGHHRQAARTYQRFLSPALSECSRSYWNRHINYFTKNYVEPSFYFRGTSGKIALMLHNRIKRKGLYKDILHLLNSRSLAEQNYYYEGIEDQLWSTFNKWLISQNTVMALLGVPPAQRNMIEEDHTGGLFEFIRSSIRRIFTQIPVRDNYFWRVYLTGSYTQTCCPNYLKSAYFDIIKDRTNRVNYYTGYLSRFLKDHPDKYSHFVLLDHQDWLANTYPDLLAEEWKLILSNASPGARILLRSAGTSNAFLPDFVLDQVDFDSGKVQSQANKDRVGTYGSTFLGVVKT